MSDDSRNMLAYQQAAARFGETGSMAAVLELIAADTVFMVNGAPVAVGRGEIAKAVDIGVQQGWIRHEIVSAAAAGGVVVITYRNIYRDGPTQDGGGALVFDDAGQITHMCAFNAQSPIH